MIYNIECESQRKKHRANGRKSNKSANAYEAFSERAPHTEYGTKPKEERKNARDVYGFEWITFY